MDQLNAFLARPLFSVSGFAPSAALVIIAVLAGLLIWRMK